ncbi:glycosyltransferase family 2 protein [Candidatus Nitrospira nitrificans]|uniref:Similar to beta-1,4-galactosyltransferase n=1 Tax=Candidatus Nitrospira nitrificans TaxID=1742973 RepID=A0A0S4L9P4_9BACT|nr:glycosyltransferase [Candidatus Nitrospira nitrificans]CUS34229.1 Similar to beta-1,4-galactosyltransferase [Candidatus Nitrospira nitrificans]
MMNHTLPLVSIGIPTYNRASSYLKAALRSAVSQTYKNIEIIVSDNCSSDHTESVVKEFDDSRIRYFRQKHNIGATKNCNFCLDQAQGKYFLMLFDDDVIDDDFISTCLGAAASQGEPGVILTGARQIDSAGNILFATHNKASGCSTTDFIFGWFDGKVPLYLCSTLFNTQRLKQQGGFYSKTHRYEDVVAYVQLAAKYGRVDVFDIKASFRRHDSNMGSATHYYEWCEDSRYLLDVMCNAVPEHADVIRKRGMTYFCVRNYRHAAGIKSPLGRLNAYFTVYRMFDYSYSPWKFMFGKNLSRIVSLMKGKIGKS